MAIKSSYLFGLTTPTSWWICLFQMKEKANHIQRLQQKKSKSYSKTPFIKEADCKSLNISNW